MQKETIARFIENRSDVPNELRDTRFRQEVNDLVRRLSDWKMLELYAIHEAGHDIYFREAGFANVIYEPPTVVYRKDDGEKPFKSQLARIIPESYVRPESDDWLLLLAKGYAAGGVCSIQLTTTDYGGDIKDRQNWNAMCADCYKDSTFTKKEADTIADELWEMAQKAVLKELDAFPRFRRLHVQRTAEKRAIPRLFPWTKWT